MKAKLAVFFGILALISMVLPFVFYSVGEDGLLEMPKLIKIVSLSSFAINGGIFFTLTIVVVLEDERKRLGLNSGSTSRAV